jgi:hypothetical protein
MRSLSVFFLFFMVIFTGLKAQDAITETTVSVEGFITNRQGKYIENVHVVNISRNWGATSNLEGQFHINAVPGDTVRFTCVGFLPYKYYVPAIRQSPVIPLHITMQVDTIQITGVEIYPWPSDAEALKKAVLAMEDQTPDVPDLKLNDPNFYNTPIPGSQPPASNPGMANPGLTYTIHGPFTALYDAFSKEAKSRRIYESLVNQDQRKVVAARRYNASVVQRVTAFKTDKEIQDFMLFCNLSVDFIVSSSEYDLYKAIHECLLAYNETKKGDVER